MSETFGTLGAAILFLAGVGLGLWIRGFFEVSQDAIRRDLGKERRGRRGCEDRERELIDQLRKSSQELAEKSDRIALLTSVISGNLFPEILDRPDTA